VPLSDSGEEQGAEGKEEERASRMHVADLVVMDVGSLYNARSGMKFDAICNETTETERHVRMRKSQPLFPYPGPQYKFHALITMQLTALASQMGLGLYKAQGHGPWMGRPPMVSSNRFD
jgi:hypothetical protein